jgi:hypothetical protein
VEGLRSDPRFAELARAAWELRGSAAYGNSTRLMFALGHKQTLAVARVTSALPPKADIAESDWHVRFVPKADPCSAA